MIVSVGSGEECALVIVADFVAVEARCLVAVVSLDSVLAVAVVSDLKTDAVFRFVAAVCAFFVALVALAHAAASSDFVAAIAIVDELSHSSLMLVAEREKHSLLHFCFSTPVH